MKRTISVAHSHNTWEVSGLEIVPGIVVHEDPVERGLWVVSHVRSGSALTEAHDPESAAMLAIKLAPFTDWTRSAAEIRGDFGSYGDDIYEVVPRPDCAHSISGTDRLSA